MPFRESSTVLWVAGDIFQSATVPYAKPDTPWATQVSFTFPPLPDALTVAVGTSLCRHVTPDGRTPRPLVFTVLDAAVETSDIQRINTVMVKPITGSLKTSSVMVTPPLVRCGRGRMRDVAQLDMVVSSNDDTRESL